MNPVLILLGSLVFVLFYFLYINYFTQKVLADKIDLNTQSPAIAYDTLPNPGASRYSYGVWIYVNSWSNTTSKYIFSRTSAVTAGSTSSDDISLYLDANSPKLYFNIKMSDSSVTTIPITNNFPIQKWTHVIVSVDNNIIDFYIDGKLLLSKQINGIPVVSTADISFGGSSISTASATTAPANSSAPDIFLAKVYRWVYPMDPQSAWNEYLSGNGQSLLIPNYNVQLELLKDNVVNKKYSLF